MRNVLSSRAGVYGTSCYDTEPKWGILSITSIHNYIPITTDIRNTTQETKARGERDSTLNTVLLAVITFLVIIVLIVAAVILIVLCTL